MDISTRLANKQDKLAVIGLGYVGLPIALEFAKKISVIGFDINQDRVNMMKNREDPSKELSPEDFEGCEVSFTSSLEDLREATFFVVAVPTPIDEHNLPNLAPLLGASETVSKVLKKGDYVVYESTVYPGCTEDDCVPVLEQGSGLTFKDDFKVGYSPERINPGDKEHTLTKIVKVAAGCDQEAADEVVKVYEMVIDAGVYRASSIKVAEAAKIIENTQRDVNIALMNELSLIFNKLGINTYEVLEAAGTKWNFLKFSPGLVGGHCIGVDPYYLTYKAREIGFHAKIINSGRALNDSMGPHTARQVVKKIIAGGQDVAKSKVLVMGATFKENVADIRNSKVSSVVDELTSFGVEVHVHDAHASSDEVKHEYGFELIPEIGKQKYDAVIVAVNHDEYLSYTEENFAELLTEKGVLVDLKGSFRGKISKLNYWSL